MSVTVKYIDAEERFAEKDAARRADLRAVENGLISEEQLRKDAASFAFPPSMARIDMSTARVLV